MLGPIFLRELLTVPRRGSHYVTRAAYLGSLWVVAMTAWLAVLGWTRPATLGETARFGSLLFQLLTYFQLALFLFFSALACASAIAKEKDRRTFVLLLMTDLRNEEIVLGKVLGSLLPILALQLATIPLLFFVVLLGGVGLTHVLQAVLVIAATTFAAGSVGGLIALWRERTFQSLALTVLSLLLFEGVVQGLVVLPGLVPIITTEQILMVRQCLEPFLALASVHEGMYQEQAGIAVSPAYLFSAVMLSLGVLVNLFSMWRLRVWNPSGEPIMQRDRPEDALDPEGELAKAQKSATLGHAQQTEARVSVHAAPGVVRHVRGNPILWREVSTRAYGRRPLVVKAAYAIVLGLICWFALYPVVAGQGQPGIFLAAIGLLSVGVLSMLLVTAQATTAITSERDTGALDLLLVTDLSAREFIFGKVLGILYNTKEYLLPPFLLAGAYGVYGCLARPPAGHPELAGPMNATALVCVIVAAAVLLSFATVLGIHVALRTPNSQVAIIHSLSTIFFLTVGTLICIALILINRRFEYQWGSFIFFLIAGIGGLWYVLSGDRPTAALSWASWFCPLAVLYSVMTILVGRPGSQESADPVIAALVIAAAFLFAIAAMLVPLLSEFDVAMGRTSGGAD
jgi:ABC-type transport system involved in multi-copper enzyme maturation permease subunit